MGLLTGLVTVPTFGKVVEAGLEPMVFMTVRWIDKECSDNAKWVEWRWIKLQRKIRVT